MAEKPVKVLIVDDDEMVCSHLAASLHMDSYEVSHASSGAQALLLMEKEWPDIVLLDIVMPGMDGYEVCKRIRAIPQPPPFIIFITGHDRLADEVDSLERGADDYIAKPISVKYLQARVAVAARLQRTQRKLYDENSRLKERLAENALVASKAAHDIRSPLSVVLNYLSLLAESALSAERVQEVCSRRVKQLLSLVDDVLYHARLNASTLELAPENLDLGEVVLENTVLLQPAAARHQLKLKMAAPASQVRAWCDRQRLCTMLQGITLFAIKHADEGGEISFEISQTGGFSRVNALFPIKCLDSREVANIFTPFHKLASGHNREDTCTGLSLALAKRMAEFQGGSMVARLQTDDGRISLFFSLPTERPAT